MPNAILEDRLPVESHSIRLSIHHPHPLVLKEAARRAIAIARGWTFLTEDQASVELLGCLYPDVPVQRTCTLLMHAVERETLTCEEAAELFNRRLVDELGFWAIRRTDNIRQRLWLRCDPARCSSE